MCLAILLGPACPGAAAESGQARVLSIAGQVSLERGRELWAVQPNDVIQPGEIIVCGPVGYAVLQLEDGSKVEVFADSRVVYRANRGNWRDLLDIFLGKVKVHVQKLGGRPNPYRVNSATALIAVRGTVFEVGVANDESTTIAVEEGIVAVTHKLLPGGREVLLKPGDSLTVHPAEPLFPASISKARLAVRVLNIALDSVLQMGRVGGVGGGRTPVPGGVPVPGGAGGTDMGQAPPPPPDVPDGDSGPGAGTPPAGGGSSAPAPAPKPPAPKPSPKPTP